MNLCILGSTGSIGRQTLELVEKDPEIRVTALAALQNIDLLTEQIHAFQPEICCVFDEEKAKELKHRLWLESGNGEGQKDKAAFRMPEIVSGMEGLIACAAGPYADTVLVSVVGMIGILPTIEAIKAGKHIAQANKEPIVCAGHIIMPLAKEKGVEFWPVDSEHSAIFQCLQGEKGNAIDKIWLTCSGGPFRGKKRAELENVTLEQTLKHPNWSMGAKITIDSATLVNKGLEVIEAHYLFGVPEEDIIVAVQPGSVVHSMVQFADGAVKAQLGAPDMKVPISYALHRGRRMDYPGKRCLGFKELSEIHFMEPDTETFAGLRLGQEACRKGGTLTTVYNAANEECVAAFRKGKIGFLQIADGIGECMAGHRMIADPSVEEIFAAEDEARRFIRERYRLG